MEGNGPSYSPGRVDQYFYGLYDSDVKSGTLTVEKALELIEAFYIKTAETTWFLSENAVMYFAGYQPFHSLIVGGIDRHGRDVTNELSYLFLTAKMDVKLHGPSVCVRAHQQSPEDFIIHVSKLARLGTGFPAIYNDEAGDQDDVAVRRHNGGGSKLPDGGLRRTVHGRKDGEMVRWWTL